MKKFFESKKISDFKNNKLYWEFQSSFIKVKFVNSDEFTPIVFADDFDRKYEDPEEIGKYFNTFFTEISSLSVSSESDCDDYIDKTFSRLKREIKFG
jgi:hypothetical protein